MTANFDRSARVVQGVEGRPLSYLYLVITMLFLVNDEERPIAPAKTCAYPSARSSEDLNSRPAYLHWPRDINPAGGN